MERKIITLCGSTRFEEEFRLVERVLTLQGHIPLPPAFFVKSEKLVPSPEMIKFLFELHLDKIIRSDEIYVIDPEGYIGDSTKKEIALAKQDGKNIRYYSKELNKIKEIIKQVDSWK